jgi:hypothetical protein
LLISIGLIVLGIVTYAKTDWENSPIVFDVIGAFCCLICAIVIFVAITQTIKIPQMDERITIYQEENTRIEEQIKTTIQVYQDYEKEIFGDINLDEISSTKKDFLSNSQEITVKRAHVHNSEIFICTAKLIDSDLTFSASQVIRDFVDVYSGNLIPDSSKILTPDHDTVNITSQIWYRTNQLETSRVTNYEWTLLTKDNKTLYLITVDGRQKNSIGMTQTELAEFLIEKNIYNALNLDGGGSTTMVAQKLGDTSLSVINSPSSGALRKVVNGIGIFNASKKSSLSNLLIEVSEENVFVNCERELIIKGYDKYYNPVEVDIEDIKWSISRCTW